MGKIVYSLKGKIQSKERKSSIFQKVAHFLLDEALVLYPNVVSEHIAELLRILFLMKTQNWNSDPCSSNLVVLTNREVLTLMFLPNFIWIIIFQLTTPVISNGQESPKQITLHLSSETRIQGTRSLR